MGTRGHDSSEPRLPHQSWRSDGSITRSRPGAELSSRSDEVRARIDLLVTISISVTKLLIKMSCPGRFTPGDSLQILGREQLDEPALIAAGRRVGLSLQIQKAFSIGNPWTQGDACTS